ncbi:MAG: transcriptional repressor [Lachnospiraceae bacterium]|nr:transcriptional repressor [Lachnospiraceae bacterium]
MEESVNYPKGIKWTKQRKNVYRILYDANEPMTALEIYQCTLERQQSGGYALSTIYRILSAFEERGLVIKAAYMDDNIVVYELDRGEHTHYAVCLSCHKRIPLQSCPFTHIHSAGNQDKDGTDKSIEESGFMVTGHKLELYGYCKDCRLTGKNL